MLNRDEVILKVKDILDSLEDRLKDEFLHGRLFYEDDILSITTRILYEGLISLNNGELKDKFFVGTKHKIHIDESKRGLFPDIVIYYYESPSRQEDFYKNRWKYLISAIEVKFANEGHDVIKLEHIQNEWKKQNVGKEILYWHIFGSHFSGDINPTEAGQHKAAEQRILDWVNTDPLNRGKTILRCGLYKTGEDINNILDDTMWNKTSRINKSRQT
jgi:hypothetical protein